MWPGVQMDVRWQLLARKAKLLPGGLGINLFLIRGLGNILLSQGNETSEKSMY